MNKLSFLHIPKIDILEEDLEIKSVCLAGGSEIDEKISYKEESLKKHTERVNILPTSVIEQEEPEEIETEEDSLGFVVGDIEKQEKIVPEETNLAIPQETIPEPAPKKKFKLPKLPKLPKLSKGIVLYAAAALILIVSLLVSYAYFAKAEVKVYVEPEILEKDAQILADPGQKTVNEDSKIIPGQIVSVEVSGSGKDSASGKKQIGDPAKGTVVIRNKTDAAITLSKGTALTGNNQKFTLDTSVTIASRSADDGTWGKANGQVAAANIGADGNIPSGVDLSVSGITSDKISAKSEGNFSGGTSKDVTVVSGEDQQRLLAKVSSDLRREAQQKLQEKYPNKKILQEALSENITKKSYNKNINDQANEFSLTLNTTFKGTAFDDSDLRTIVSKLVNTQVPDGFILDLSSTETQADVSKLEKDGRLIFLAKFKAKLMPKIDIDKIKNQIKFKTPKEAGDIIKNMENILGSDIKIIPSLPAPLLRLPLLSGNIKVDVGLK